MHYGGMDIISFEGSLQSELSISEIFFILYLLGLYFGFSTMLHT